MSYEVDLDPTQPAALLVACPAYDPSPLVRHSIGPQSVLVKDESERMGLGAFKALGGVYAVARLIELYIGTAIQPNEFLDDPIRDAASTLTFVCASAGNHGMSVAAGANLFGAKCRVHLAETVSEDFAERLRAKDAQIVRSGETYEESVAAAVADAEATGAVHLADGSWTGYTEPPRLVMEGYTVIAEELRRSFEGNGQWPTHVYLQAGVGGLAASLAHMIRTNWSHQPEIIVVEPEFAQCLRASVAAGELITVSGPVSGMGRLDCKTPSLLAFDILSETADRFVTLSETQSLAGVAAVEELGIATTPSGAAGLSALLQEHDSPELPLVIISEGRLASASIE